MRGNNLQQQQEEEAAPHPAEGLTTISTETRLSFPPKIEATVHATGSMKCWQRKVSTKCTTLTVPRKCGTSVETSRSENTANGRPRGRSLGRTNHGRSRVLAEAAVVSTVDVTKVAEKSHDLVVKKASRSHHTTI